MPWASLKSNANTRLDLSQFCALYIDVRIEVETQGTTSPNPTEITRVRKRDERTFISCMIMHHGGCYMRASYTLAMVDLTPTFPQPR